MPYPVLGATRTEFLPHCFSSVPVKPNTPVITVSLPQTIAVIYAAAFHNVPEVKKTKYA